ASGESGGRTASLCFPYAAPALREGTAIDRVTRTRLHYPDRQPGCMSSSKRVENLVLICRAKLGERGSVQCAATRASEIPRSSSRPIATEPSAGKAGATQSVANVRRVAQSAPHKTGEIILHHQDYRSLVDGVMPFANPSCLAAVTVRRIEGRLVTVTASELGV